MQHVYVNSLWPRVKKCWVLYLLILPTLLYLIVYRYYPMILQIILSFKDYRLTEGILKSPWAGFDIFKEMIEMPDFGRILYNTVIISSLRLLVEFFPPILLAILLFDLKSATFRRISQTIIYIPHFFSWVIVYAIVFAFFSNVGLINQVLSVFGLEIQDFLMDSKHFYSLLLSSSLWKEIGWSTIIYLAALTGINSELFEAAKIDGAGPIQRIWNVTIPGILPVIIFLFTIAIGNVLRSAGAEQILLFYSPATYDVADVIDTWVYRHGLTQLQYSLGACVSLFQSFFGMILVFIANKVSIKLSGIGLW